MFGGLVYGHDLTVEDERLQVVLVSLHALLDVLNQIHVGFGDILEVSGEYADLAMIVVHLASQAVVLVLASELLAIEPSEDVLKPPGWFCKHGLAGDAKCKLAVFIDLPEIAPDLNKPSQDFLLIRVLRNRLLNAQLVLNESLLRLLLIRK